MVSSRKGHEEEREGEEEEEEEDEEQNSQAGHSTGSLSS